MRWLVTAFEPFAGAQSNVSDLVLAELAQKDWQGQVSFLRSVPVTFQGAWPYIQKHLERESFDGVLALGQAEGRMQIDLECVALNWIDARIPDNAGERPEGRRVLRDGPEVQWTNIPWQSFSLPPLCRKSYSAGVYVCNATMFELLEWAKKNGKLAGFVHIPLLEVQVESQFQGLPRLAKAEALATFSEILRFLVAL